MILISPKTVYSTLIFIFPKIIEYINMKIFEINVEFRITIEKVIISFYYF